MFVGVEVDQSCPPAPLHVMFPTPKAMVRTLVLLEEKNPVVSAADQYLYHTGRHRFKTSN
jgi:hypothetical protein